MTEPDWKLMLDDAAIIGGSLGALLITMIKVLKHLWSKP